MAYQDVETLVLNGESSDVWLTRVEPMDIVEYLGRTEPTHYHPDVIPLICRYPFEDEEIITFVCERFVKLMIYSEKYLYQYKDRTDSLIFIAGFLEAAAYTPAVSQLIFHRNLLLKQGRSDNSAEVLALNHAIAHLYRKKFKI
ncbi:MAG: hypothetical protein H6970_13115 [Gammaproteobacteria bacterium]|nr:hypothetical protein [Gammaproteobacteria bacterium]MCP5458825.1 hypothetical protein [Gammaproteobacteria bacterium]